jgi:CRP-like cAMP-binding protein
MLTAALRTTPAAASDKSFIRRLEACGAVAPADLAVLEAALHGPETYRTGDLLHPPRPGAPPFFMVSGWACLARLLDDGRRQVLAFLLPGDGVGFDLLTQSRESTRVVALTSVKIQRVRQSLLGEITGCQSVSRALAVASNQQQTRLIDQVVRLGRQTAYERCAHLLLELHGRLAEIGETQGDGFRLPIKQEVLADALGLSLVHVNRTLQQLRRDQLVEVHGGAAFLKDRQALAAICEYRSG